MPQAPPQPPKRRTRKPSATRLLKGAQAAGLQVRGIELDSTGTMRVLVGKPDEAGVEKVKALAK
jgi:hypothetical protein